ncbi:hypothetical protein Patl1_02667 [Pistacia atlantica]|uniref:Uncharacterized protein n=1 Tax=Pistacia atlantica TaxID=434234 RepID=A0ACC1C594_9ROSI|nr:hypothetical protein Patl1_02667 [Pistacia atlantica]
MAAHNIFTLSSFVVLLLLLHKHFYLIEATRPLVGNGDFHPPALPLGSKWSKVKPPASISYTINRYKKTEADAFRPTSPGHSPGVGHDVPPHAS